MFAVGQTGEDGVMRPRTGAAAIAVLAVLASGCGGDDPGEPTTQESGQPTTTPTESPTSESPTSESPGGLPSSAGQLPESFPTEEVPLVEGEIGEVLENEGIGSYLVKVYTATDFATAFEDASTRLTGAGFEQGPEVLSAGPTSSTADFTSDNWFVVVTGGMPDPERTMVQYTIYPE